MNEEENQEVVTEPVAPVTPVAPVEPAAPAAPVAPAVGMVGKITKEALTDPDPFNDFLDEGKLSEEKIKSYLETSKTEDAKKDKRINDLRAKMSKKDAPKAQEEYFYKNEKYDTLLESEGVKAEIAELKAKAFEKGMGQGDFEFMTTEILSQLETYGIVDTRSEAEKEDVFNQELSKLGENGREVYNNSKQWVDDNPIFNEEEKTILNGLMEQGAGFVNIVSKLNRLHGNVSAVPVDNAVYSGLASDRELLDEYNSADTKEGRRREIIELRIKANRKGKLQDAANY